MTIKNRQRSGAMPDTLDAPVPRLCLPLASAAALAVLAFFPALAPAAEGVSAPPVVTPIDKEQDQQDKFRLQEKIKRELEENRRRVLEESKKKSEKAGRKVPYLSPEKEHADHSKQLIDGAQ